MKFSLEQLKDAFISGLDIGYMEASRYGEPDNDNEFEEWFKLNHKEK